MFCGEIREKKKEKSLTNALKRVISVENIKLVL